MNNIYGFHHLSPEEARNEFLNTVKPVLAQSPKEFQDLIIESTDYLYCFGPDQLSWYASSSGGGDVSFRNDIFSNPRISDPFVNTIVLVSYFVHECTHNQAGTGTNHEEAVAMQRKFLDYWIPIIDDDGFREQLMRLKDRVRSYE